MPEDKSVTGFIRSMNSTKLSIEVDIVKRVLDLVQSNSSDNSSGYDPTNEIIDLMFAVTGYGGQNVPGGETHVASNCIAKLVRYMILRAKDKTDESLHDALLGFVTESVRLYAEVQANKGVRVILERGDKK
jgi:hypothetical protein